MNGELKVRAQEAEKKSPLEEEITADLESYTAHLRTTYTCALYSRYSLVKKEMAN